MNVYINNINKNIEPLRQEIINHKLYSTIRNIEDLKIFMKYHVYAVWDFMSILKTLQNNLTCTSVPWFPVGNADTRFLINEIVVGEESDVDQNGIRKSHFELYIDAMDQCGADTQPIKKFINELKVSKDFNTAFILSETPKEAADFVKYTFDIINSDKHHLQSAIFTFGREDLIPGMFISMVNDIHNNFPNDISIFKYYLERHIEIDGDYHSNLALEMTSSLCANNKEFWEQAEIATIESLKQRINLWNGACNEITSLQLAN